VGRACSVARHGWGSCATAWGVVLSVAASSGCEAPSEFLDPAGVVRPAGQALTAGPLTAGTASGAGWVGTANTTTINTAYATYNATGQDDLILTNFGFSVPGVNLIDGIVVERTGNGAGSSPAARRYRMGLTQDGATPAGTRKTGLALPKSTDDTVTVGTVTDLWGGGLDAGRDQLAELRGFDFGR